ncbi:MAG: LAGLIDADG family homing endonuclease [Halanaerobiales bacterium]
MCELRIKNNEFYYDRRAFEYCLGLIHGDGHVKPTSVRIFIEHTQKEFISTVKNQMFKAFNIKPLIRRPNKSVKTVAIYSTKLATHLLNYKDSTTGKWSIPDKLSYPEEWLAGVWDTDGHVGLRNSKIECIFAQKSNGNIKYVERALSEIGVNRYNISETVDFRWQEPVKMQYLRIWLKDTEIFAKKVPLKHPKKKNALKVALNNNTFSNYHPRGELKDDIKNIIKKNPVLSTKEIADLLDSSSQQMSSYLNSLLQKEIIKKTESNDTWYLNEEIKIKKWGH